MLYNANNLPSWELYVATPTNFYGVACGTTMAFNEKDMAEDYLQGFEHGGIIRKDQSIIQYVDAH